MAKAKKFVYTVTFTVTSPEEIKAKALKAAVSNEIGYITDTFEGAKVGKVDVVAVE
jgi:hypothetical protein